MPDGSSPQIDVRKASDGYPILVATWQVPPDQPLKGRVLVLHGVQSHQGWYHRLGRNLAEAGYEAIFPDRRGSGANTLDRGHVESAGRFVADVAEQLQRLKGEVPTAVVGISWGGKIALATAAVHPGLVDRIVLLCPGLHPRVGVGLREGLRIAKAFVTNRRKMFPVPLSDPALFTDNPEGQAFIANDPLALRSATAGLLAASVFLDRRVRKAQSKIVQPILLVIGGLDRIVDNAKTLTYFNALPSTEKTVIDYPEGHHTLEFDLNPDQYARDLVAWLDQGLSAPSSLTLS